MSRSAQCLVDADTTQHIYSELSRFAIKRQLRLLAVTLNVWHERSKQRRQLIALADDPDLLKDLGLSNYDLRHEGGKPFWRK